MRPSAALFATFLTAAFPALADAPKTQAPAAVPGAPSGGLKVLPAVEMEVPNRSGVTGETKDVEATLTSGGKALPGKTVQFSVAGTVIGHAATNAAGKASVPYRILNMAQGTYDLGARFAGDESYRAGDGKGAILIVKAMTDTRIEFTTVSDESRSKSPNKNTVGLFLVHVVRKSDGKKLDSAVSVKVNGATYTPPSGTARTEVPYTYPPGSHSPWKVEVQFEGNLFEQPSAATGTQTLQ